MECETEVSTGVHVSRWSFVETGLAAIDALAVGPALAGCGNSGAGDWASYAALEWLLGAG